jgi:hypothetical protein
VSRPVKPFKGHLAKGARFAADIRQIFKKTGVPVHWGDLQASFLYRFVYTRGYTDSRFWFPECVISPFAVRGISVPVPVRPNEISKIITPDTPGADSSAWEKNQILRALYFAHLCQEAGPRIWKVVLQISALGGKDIRKQQLSPVKRILAFIEDACEFVVMRKASGDIRSGMVAISMREIWCFKKENAKKLAERYTKKFGMKGVTARHIEEARKIARQIKGFNFRKDFPKSWEMKNLKPIPIPCD